MVPVEYLEGMVVVTNPHTEDHFFPTGGVKSKKQPQPDRRRRKKGIDFDAFMFSFLFLILYQ